jgi:hypothetical protein
MKLLNRHGLTPLQAAIAVKMFADAEGIETYWGLTKDERQQLGFDLADKFLELPEERQLEFVSAAKSVVIGKYIAVPSCRSFSFFSPEIPKTKIPEIKTTPSVVNSAFVFFMI